MLSKPTRPALLIAACALMLLGNACSDDDNNNAAEPDNNAPNNAADANDGDADPPPMDASDDDITDQPDADPPPPPDFTDPATPPPCQSDRNPIIAAHGFLASGDTYALHALRLASNGYCLDRIHPFDWNTLDGDAPNEDLLDAFIDKVLADNNAAQVDLWGHSAGGNLGYSYLSEPQRAAKVAHYVHIGSFVNEGPAGPADNPVPTLNLWSQGDLIIDPKDDIPGATNVSLQTEDHYAVATSEASFTAIYNFITDGQEPQTTTVTPEDTLYISGKALSLGENAPVVEGVVTIFALDDQGKRQGDPVAVFPTDELGHWGPFIAQPQTHYEMRVQPPGPDATPVHYYREPFTRSNDMVYLRTLPGPGSLAGTLLSIIPFKTGEAVTVIFMSSRALNDTTDTLTIGDLTLSTPEVASPDQTTIAIFLYDANGDGETQGTAVSTFGSFPFLNAVDAALPADGQPIDITLNGRTLTVEPWSAAEEGATIAVFD